MLSSKTSRLRPFTPIAHTYQPTSLRFLPKRAASSTSFKAQVPAPGTAVVSSGQPHSRYLPARHAVPSNAEAPVAATAAAAAADAAQDVGNIIFLEHVYMLVPDLEVARLFYGEGLGLTHDPGTLGGTHRTGMNVVHYNIGKQQVGQGICR